MKKLFDDFLTWLKKPNPDTTLVNWWKRKEERHRAKVIQRSKAERQAEEEYQESIRTEAYLLWEADGKPKGKDDYYWTLAIDKVTGQKISNFNFICKLYYLLEKRVLEPTDKWISRQAFFTILGRLGNLAVVVTIVTFVFGENVRRNNEVFSAWQTITSAEGQTGSGGRIEALEFLNSRPWRFPWIGWTEEEWFWDENKKECNHRKLPGFRWERQPLTGLSASGAYLADVKLCGASLENAYLIYANLEGANLGWAILVEAELVRANLWGADLKRANLGGAILVEAELVAANLGEANLAGADLRRAILTVTRLNYAYLIYANLGGANLWGADLRFANLEGANKIQIS